jgi:RNA polymerase nonessential primary-like sigma factor
MKTVIDNTPHDTTTNKEPLNTPETIYTHHEDALSQYLGKLQSIKLLTKAEEIHYGNLVQSGCASAFQVMFMSNLRLVVSKAKRLNFNEANLPLMDLIAEGNFGLVEAVKKFNPERGFRFSTYATPWIHQAILRAHEKYARNVRWPSHVVKAHYALRCAMDNYVKTGTKVDIDELSNTLGVSVDRVRELMSLHRWESSLDTPIKDNENQTLMVDLIEAEVIDFDVSRGETEQQFIIRTLLAKHLSPRDAFIVRARFGFNTDIITLEQLGFDLGLTREGVRKIEISSLKKLKSALGAQGLDVHDFFLTS